MLLQYQVNSLMPTLRGGNGSDEHMVHPFVAQTMFNLEKFIFHQHTKGTKGNVDLIRAYGMPVIITIRNIFDVMLSVKEKMDDGVHCPCIQGPVPWRTMKDSLKWAWLGHNIPAWTFQFYASWHYADVNKLWVKYEDYYTDQPASMARILRFLNATGEADLKNIIDIESNKKVGISGRGRKAVPSYIKKNIVAQTVPWGDTGKLLRRDLF
jgi:hypothetical protein